MKKAAIIGIAICLALLGLGFGLFRLFVWSASDPVQVGVPSTVVGARLDGSHLVLAFGAGCPQSMEVTIESDGGSGWESIDEVLRFTTGQSPYVLDLNDLPPDASIIKDLPDGFDWNGALVIHVSTDRPFRTSSFFVHKLQDSSAHPAGEYYYERLDRWATPDEIDAQVGGEIATFCTPN